MSPNIDPIPFARPSIGAAEEEAVLRVLRSGWLTTGKEALAFEREFAELVGVRHAKAVSSATAGLHLALEAIGVSEGDVVITTPYTFTATAEVVRYLGAEVRFADIEPDSFNIDPAAIERALWSARNSRPNTIPDRNTAAREPAFSTGTPPGGVRAVVPVHIGGYACRMSEIRELCDAARVAMVEDAAHAFPVETPEGFLGTLGSAGVYSFYANKTITTGEGGMVVTESKRTADRVSVMRNHGIDRDAWDRYTRSGASWEYAVVAPGYKYNMSDVAASIGRAQLSRAHDFLDRRKRRAEQYLSALSGLDYLRMPPHSGPNAWHLFIMTIEPERLSITRDDLIRGLADRRIGTSVHYIPLHVMPYYRDRYGLRPSDFPNALSRYRNSVSLPLYPDMTEEQVHRVASAVREICEATYLPRAR